MFFIVTYSGTSDQKNAVRNLLRLTGLFFFFRKQNQKKKMIVPSLSQPRPLMQVSGGNDIRSFA